MKTTTEALNVDPFCPRQMSGVQIDIEKFLQWPRNYVKGSSKDELEKMIDVQRKSWAKQDMD